MGGRTISNDPGVIRRFERDRAQMGLEARILAVHLHHYPYQGEPPNRAQIDTVISAISALLRDPDQRPMVLTALGISGSD